MHDDKTTRGYPLPSHLNALEDDVARLRVALGMIDDDVSALPDTFTAGLAPLEAGLARKQDKLPPEIMAALLSGGLNPDIYISAKLQIMMHETPGTYTWTVPDGVNEIWVSAAAGGGGGSGGGTYSGVRIGGSSGGGGAAILHKRYTVTAGQKITIVVGAGGTGGAAGSPTSAGGGGANGGATSLSGLVSLAGGGRSSGQISAGSAGGAGGFNGLCQYGTNTPWGLDGGNTILGHGGKGAGAESSGIIGTFGGGGGGGGATASFYSSGVAGANGVVIIEWIANDYVTQPKDYGIPHGCEKFDTPGTYNWTVPEKVTEIWVSAAAGGAGGAGGGRRTTQASDTIGGGGGGAGDSILDKAISVVPGEKIKIIVGLGGTGGIKGSATTYGTTGAAGGSTIITAATASITLAGGGVPLTYGFTGFDCPSVGGKAGGLNAQRGRMSDAFGGDGGDNLLGFGGRGGFSEPLNDGALWSGENGRCGCGGGGGGGRNDRLGNGGKGGDGVVIIEW